jgi:hypothetical protein
MVGAGPTASLAQAESRVAAKIAVSLDPSMAFGVICLPL